ncbi:hypothetical protein [Streptomyces caelestis]
MADRPEEVPAVLAERFNSGDAVALAQVYEEAAVLVPSREHRRPDRICTP